MPDQQSSPATPPPGKKRPRGKAFAKGGDARQAQHMVPDLPGCPTPDPEDGLSELARMRKVYEQPKTIDRGAKEKALRKWLDTQPTQFFARMDRLAAGEAGTQATGGADPGAEKLTGLIDELLETWGAE